MTEEGYVQGFDVIESQPRDILEITMKYGVPPKRNANFQRESSSLRDQSLMLNGGLAMT